jgi:hypothetical protein
MSIQVPERSGAFFFGCDLDQVRAREADQAEASDEHGSERTSVCVSDRRSPTTWAWSDIVGAP